MDMLGVPSCWFLLVAISLFLARRRSESHNWASLAVCITKGLDSAQRLGVEAMFTAPELADPSIDHLTLMVYLSKFNNLTRQKSNTERLAMDSHLPGLTAGHTSHAVYRDDEVTEHRDTFNTRHDVDNVRVECDTPEGHVDQPGTLQVMTTSTAGDMTLLEAVPTVVGLRTSFLPACVGSPKDVEVWDPVRVHVFGDGIVRATKGLEAYFTVCKNGFPGEITAEVEVSGQTVPCSREIKSQDECEFCYVPTQAGTYKVHVQLQRQPVAGSPFSAHVIDRSQVTILDDLQPLKDECGRLALEYGQKTQLTFDVTSAGAGVFKAEVLSPGGKLPVEIRQSADRVTASFVAQHQGDHYIHLYWSQAPIDFSPLHAYCPGPQLSVDASKVKVEGNGAEAARATVPAEFLINGMLAGPGVPRVKVQGIYAELPVEVKGLKYNRYLCRYTSNVPGSFLLYVYWSDQLLPDCPLKIAVTSKGDISKVKVSGDGLNGGVSNTELKICVDTSEAGPGEVAAECHSHRHSARCDIKEDAEGRYTLRILPTESEKHVLHITYDGQHVPGSPFTLRICEPPDASKVRVFGPGIRDGLVDTFESRFLVDTQGAGAGQLAVKIRGPKGGFRVDMSRETKAERTIVCRYDPSECGQYIISVRWSGVDVPGSPFLVRVVDTQRELVQLNIERPSMDTSEDWRADI